MSDKIVLKVFKAKKVDESDHKSLLDIFNNLCKKANIDGPRLFVYQDDTPNAFATGRNEKNSADFNQHCGNTHKVISITIEQTEQ